MAVDRNMRGVETDSEFENRIRPQELDNFSGQEKIVENLRIFIRAALMRGETLDHVLLHGPPGSERPRWPVSSPTKWGRSSKQPRVPCWTSLATWQAC